MTIFGVKGTMADIKNKQDLEKWLEGKPEQVARVIALRCALRVLPLNTMYKNLYDKEFANIVLLVFRCVSLTFSISLSPSNEKDSRANIIDLVNYAINYTKAYPIISAIPDIIKDPKNAIDIFQLHSIGGARGAAVLAACSTLVDYYPDGPAVLTVESADIAYEEYFRYTFPTIDNQVVTIWSGVSADCTALDNSMSTVELAQSRIWLNQYSKWFSEANSELKTALLPLNQDWDVWTRWFDARINGVRADEVLETRRV